MVGASGFEPPTSWSRTMNTNSINALSGVAYGTRSLVSPLLVVRSLSEESWRPGGSYVIDFTALEKPITMLRRLSLDSSQQYFLTNFAVNPSP